MFAMMMYELISQNIPYHWIINAAEVIGEIRRGCRPPLDQQFPETIKHLMHQMWNDVEDLRPDWPEIQSVLGSLYSGDYVTADLL